MAAKSYSLDEKFEFSAKAKKNIFIILAIGIVLFAIGIFMEMSGGGSHGAHGDSHGQIEAVGDALASTEAAGHAVEAEGHGYHWTKKLYANLWLNNMFFTGIALIGVFFVAIQYISTSGWSAGIKRIPESFGYFLPVTFVLVIITFFLGGHDIFHWTHDYLYEKGGSQFDAIINGKKAYFFNPMSDEVSGIPMFYLVRMVIFFGGWILFFLALRNLSLKEDLEGGTRYYRKMVRLSAAFIVFFGISSSVAAWDWIMSIDTHWFSTMFGWYVFASWFVSGLAAITLSVVLLKEAGYLNIINENHLHDLGKYVFAFSIFWTYIWFSQFLLIYYANIPEETIYFWERLQSDFYSKFILGNLFLNFFFPFMVLMTRDSKRKMTFLKIVCSVVLVGHWFDFYLMIMPGTLKEHGGVGFLEIGLAMIYLAGFAFVAMMNLSKTALIAKNHPLIEEAVHHHI